MKTLFIVLRILGASILIIVAVICLFGVLCYYRQPECYLFGLGFGMSFFGALACMIGIDEEMTNSINH